MRKYKFFTIIFSFFSICMLFSNEAFTKPFTGKVLGNKVRLRVGPDLNSHIIKQINKNSLLLITGVKNDYYKVRPPVDTKLYVYKTYIENNVVQRDRVNIRLNPNTESPVMGQLMLNQTVDAKVYALDTKWMEITPPNDICFYISKEYIQEIGDSTYYAYMLDRKAEVTKLLDSAFFITQAECKKPYSEMKPQKAVSQFEAIIKGYTDFPEFVQQAKEGLALIQDNYLQKKIVYLETKANMLPEEKEELFKEVETLRAKGQKTPSYNTLASSSLKNQIFNVRAMTDKMKTWMPIENDLYSTWSTFHPEKSVEDFYSDQAANAIIVKGKLEAFNDKIKNKPGDYIIKGKNVPLAYLYSIHVDLEKHIGKEVTIYVSPRPNNNFAFPAYFVNSVK